MRKYRLLTLPIAGLIGFFLLFPLFKRFDPSATWGQRLARENAITKAREMASRFGIDTNGSTTIVRADYEPSIEIYRRVNPNGLWASLLTPTTIQVRFVDYKNSRSFEVQLNANGEPIEIQRRNHSSPGGGGRQTGPPDPNQPPPPPATVKSTLEQDRQKAEEALPLILGKERSSFSATPTIAENQGRREFTWVATDERLKLVAEVILREGEISDVFIRHTPTPKYRAELDTLRPESLKFISNTENLVLWPAFISVIFLYFTSIARKQINHRETLRFLLLTFLYLVLINSMGTMLDGLRVNFRFSMQQPIPWLERTLPWVLFLLANAFAAAGLYIFRAAGSALPIKESDEHATDLTLLLKGRLRARPLAESIFYGLFAGGLLCTIPYLVASVGMDSLVMLDSGSFENSFSARFPAAVSFASAVQYFVLLMLAYPVPFLEAYIKRRLLATVSIFAVLWMTIAGIEFVHIGTLTAIVVITLISYVLLWLYRNFGVISVALAMMTAQAAVTAASLLSQPAAEIQSSGWRTIFGLGAALIGGVVLFLRARDLSTDEILLKNRQTETRAERERLRAEFDVARRAQQHMLPDAAPSIPGFNIAAVCYPSKEVGGDLYDFLPLRDGKLGIVVADVSGKGVPASLYMTLTKGLLESVSENKTDPGEILRDVNRHLYDVCRRKMFVTLVFGVLDPQTKTLSYARAGHNPTVHRSPSNQMTSLLKARGMGLGLNNGKLFDGSLRVETITLQSRDKLYFYSDGITEAMNSKNEEYGEERLMAIAAKVDELSADEARDTVLADVKNFLGENQPQDDQTLVVLEVR